MVQDDNLDSKVRRNLSAVNSFALHAAAAVIVSPIIVIVEILGAVILFHNSRGVNSIANVGGVTNPISWIPGLLLGLLLNRIALRRTACWVWVVGIAWLACGIIESLYNYHARFAGICSPFDNVVAEFFSMSGGYCGNGINISAFTWPLFNSIAYSGGAWLALLWFGRGKQRVSTAR
jgi:hypothetical protein